MRVRQAFEAPSLEEFLILRLRPRENTIGWQGEAIQEPHEYPEAPGMPGTGEPPVQG